MPKHFPIAAAHIAFKTHLIVVNDSSNRQNSSANNGSWEPFSKLFEQITELPE